MMREPQNRVAGASAAGLLLLCFDYSAAASDEFNDWYDTEHIPERERTKGFLTAQRWLGVANKRVSVATYDLDNVGVLNEPAYLAIGGDNLSPWSKRIVRSCKLLLRFEGFQLGTQRRLASVSSRFLLLVTMDAEGTDVHRQHQASLEHLDRMAAVPGVQSARVFCCTNGTTNVLELYELDSPAVPTSQTWSEADVRHANGNLATRSRFVVLCERYSRTSNASHRV